MVELDAYAAGKYDMARRARGALRGGPKINSFGRLRWIWPLALITFWLCMAPWLHAADPDPKPLPSVWWVHAPVAAHIMSAAQDGLSSWKQSEANSLYTTQVGPQAGHFYREGAGRMAGITLGICAVSEVVGFLKPTWRKYIGALNLGAAAAHVGVTTSNVVRNPYYR